VASFPDSDAVTPPGGIGRLSLTRQELRDRERRLRAAEAVAGVGTYVLDIATGEWLASPQLERIFGIDAKSIRDIDLWIALVHPDDRERMAAYYPAAVRELGRFEADYRIVRRNDGAVRWVAGIGEFERDAAGAPIRMIGTIQDITVRKQAEQALRSSEEQHRRLFETMVQGVVYQDAAGCIITANPAAERILGLSIAQMKGLSSLDPRWRAIREDGSEFPGSVHPAMEALRTGNEVRDVVMGVFNPTHEDYTWVNICAVPLFREGDVRPFQVYATIEDITDRKRAEESRRRMDAELQRAQRLESLGLVAGGIAHDFNNLLTAILGHINLARTTTGDAVVVRELGDAEKASHQAVGLANQLLTFARGGAPVRKIIALAPVLRETTDFCVRGTSVSVAFDIGDLWPVDVDPAQIAQVVQNIVVNAVQAMPNGGTLSVSARNAPAGEAPFVRVRVTDTGVGIPPEHRDRLFDLYFTTRSTGSGLGLPIAYSILRRHGGSIAVVESQTGAGTTIGFDLPAVARPARTGPAEEVPARAADRTATILIMDDEEMVAKLLQRMLERKGHRVVSTRDGQAAIDRYVEFAQAGTPFDLVILDLTVRGGLGGLEANRGIRAFDPGARLIVSSGYSDDPVMASYAEHGFAATLAKPYRVDDLFRVIQGVLAAPPPGA
jgi:PAS domain S-box-containing protein